MPKIVKPLTARQVETAKPGKHFDGGGLYLEVSKTGRKTWRLKYRSPATGKERTATLGQFPAVSLSDARAWRDTQLNLIAMGRDPQDERKRKVATFGELARQLIEGKNNVESHKAKQRSRLERYILPYIGDKPVTEIEALEVDDLIKRIPEAFFDTRKRILWIIKETLNEAVTLGLIPHNPATALTPKRYGQDKRDNHYGTLTRPDDVRHFFTTLFTDDSFAHHHVAHALRFQSLTIVRPGNIRSARWSDIDFDEAVWKIPADQMKVKRPHTVPLIPEALAILEEMRRFTGGYDLIFPSVHSGQKRMSENTLNFAVKRLDPRMTSHGIRHAFRSTVGELWPAEREVAERILAHDIHRNDVEAAYDKSERMEARRELLERWWRWITSSADD